MKIIIKDSKIMIKFIWRLAGNLLRKKYAIKIWCAQLLTFLYTTETYGFPSAADKRQALDKRDSGRLCPTAKSRAQL